MGTSTRDTKRVILNGISAYFNPGNLIGIMGPSGSGKTTFLDLLTGRRKYESANVKVRKKEHTLCLANRRNTLAYRITMVSLLMEFQLMIFVNGTLPTLAMCSSWPHPTMKS